jgi:hypothetical protein
MVAIKEFAIGDQLIKIPNSALVTLQYCESTERGKLLMKFYPNNAGNKAGDVKMKNDM